MEAKPFKFLPFSADTLLRLSRVFLPFGVLISRTFPSIKSNLLEIGLDINSEDYVSVSTFSSAFLSLLFFAFTLSIGIFTGHYYKILLISAVSGAIMFFTAFFYFLLYIKLEVIKKIKLLEKDLLFALRYIYIRVKSGISLYDAMVGVAYGHFGEVSKEFKKTIKEISGGIDELKALENMALRNPSLYFRRVIWQITNNLRAGADIADILKTITSSLVKEHKLFVRKYGSELNPIILMYMMFTIILPSLGVTVIVVMSAFSGLFVPVYIFYVIPVFIFALQFFFISIIKNKRPLMVI
jgi:pilus assembly protein TadC